MLLRTCPKGYTLFPFPCPKVPARLGARQVLKHDGRSLSRYYLDALAVDSYREHFRSGLVDGGFDARASVRLNQQDYAASAASAANFACQRAFSKSVVNNAINGFCGDGRQISLAKRPFFTHQAACFAPIGGFQRYSQKLGDG